MDQAEAESKARDGYDRMALEYTSHVSREMTVPSLVRSVLELFAHQVQNGVTGTTADVGCGPGHVTAHLAGLGLDIVGVDNSPALLDIAREANPELRFEIGQLASLPFETGSLHGLVSRHSLIHTPADLVPATLAEFKRVLAPEGLLFLSFFGAETPANHGDGFDHAVTTAYQLDISIMAELLDAAGFTEEVRIVRQPREGERQLPHGMFFARRQSPSKA